MIRFIRKLLYSHAQDAVLAVVVVLIFVQIGIYLSMKSWWDAIEEEGESGLLDFPLPSGGNQNPFGQKVKADESMEPVSKRYTQVL